MKNPTQYQKVESRKQKENSMLVVIDPSVQEYQMLATGVQKGAEVLILDPNRDGVEQITAVLERRTNVSSLHLISHGSPGCLYLGKTKLSLETLEGYAQTLKTWVDSSASILLYGCQVAAGRIGNRFLERLQQLTGANIAASTRLVGNAAKGGSWGLDYRLGKAISQLAFLPEVRQVYQGVFAPVVSFEPSPTVLVEDEGPGNLGTKFSFIFKLSEPPSGEVKVRVTGNVEQNLNQFALSQEPLVYIGTYPNGVATPDDLFTSFEYTIIEQTASITTYIFDNPEAGDPVYDGERFVTYTLEVLSGGTVDPNANSATIGFYDTRAQVPPPVVSLTASPTTLVESEQTATTLTLTLDKLPPQNGLQVTIDSDTTNALNEFNLSAVTTTGIRAVSGRLLRPNSDNSGFSVVITQQTATIRLPVLDDTVVEPEKTLAFSLQSGAGYTINPSSSSVSLTVDGSEPLPIVAIEANPRILVEAEQTVTTLTFTLSQPPPPEGITILVDSNTPNALDQFALNQATLTGGRDLTPNADRSGFSFTLTQTTATIQLPILNDGIDERFEPLKFTIQPDDTAYAVSPTKGSIRLVLADTEADVPAFVAIAAAPTTLLEAEQTLTTLTFTLSKPPPEAGLDVTLDSDTANALADFDLSAASFNGAEFVSANEDSSGFTIRITAQTATIQLPVLNDGVEEGNENLTFAIQPGTDYLDDEAASSITLSIEDPIAEPIAPSLNPNSSNNIFRLDGSPSLTTNLEFNLVGGGGSASVEVGFFTVDDDNGGLDTDEDGTVDINPGDANYETEALKRGQSMLSFLPDSSLPNPSAIAAGLTGGSRFAFYLVLNDTTENILGGNIINSRKAPSSRVIFGSPQANGNLNQLEVSPLSAEGVFTLNFGSQSEDFSNLALTFKQTSQAPPPGSGLQSNNEGQIFDLRGADLDNDGVADTEVTANFIVNNEAAFDDFVGFYRVDNEQGQIGDLTPEEPGYAAAAIERRIISLDDNGASTINLSGDNLGFLAPFIIVGGSPEDFLDDNPRNDPTKEPLAYFNFSAANRDGFDHIMSVGSNRFGFEDLFNGGDKDYDDMIVQVDFL